MGEGGRGISLRSPLPLAGDFFNFILIKVLIMAMQRREREAGKKGGPVHT